MSGEERFAMPDLLASGGMESLDGVIATLIELGADRDQIEVVPVGIFRRYRGFLQAHWPTPGTAVREDERIVLYVSERSLADRLPEGFLRNVPEEDRPEGMVEGDRPAMDRESLPDGGPGRDFDPYEMARRQLDGGRKLLWVLDRALRRARRDLLIRQRALWATAGDAEVARRVLGLVGLGALETTPGAAVFAAASLAGFQEAVGTLTEAAALMSALFGVPVRGEEAPPHSIPIPDELQSHLGEARTRLGRDTIAGRRLWDPRPGAVFRVGPMSAEEAGRRHLDREGVAAFEAVAAALMPAGRPVRIEYEIVRPQQGMRPGLASHGLLGKTSYVPDRLTATPAGS